MCICIAAALAICVIEWMNNNSNCHAQVVIAMCKGTINKL